MLPESGRFLQDTSHDVHLSAAVAESLKEIQIVREEAAVQLVENLVHNKRCHDAQGTKLHLCEHPSVHALQRKNPLTE